jgi:hypothetical protein
MTDDIAGLRIRVIRLNLGKREGAMRIEAKIIITIIFSPRFFHFTFINFFFFFSLRIVPRKALSRHMRRGPHGRPTGFVCVDGVSYISNLHFQETVQSS